ncbi:prephenate dehydrogenase [Methanolinea mesophila]|uniref:prephenate dehydrogenase/arogenate dehydrogenase family protein n=1 Tax=Methanolinea mesophila TaxID=547055 RepID=UPI001AE7B0AB|nr:prephenate dehydrogenase/arogenate dehydrogenase family protein [Methanolinea mesophila]MBP1927864.1 prephenate dehydrogenase [Methanolinea mesophila]
MQVCIIGGRGRMGSLFGEVFARAGYKVVATGRETDPAKSDAVTGSDIVMVSVPIRETRKVIGQITPVLTADQLVCDLTSLKAEPVEAMLASRAEVIGLHPMFGPTVPSLLRQTIIMCPERCREETRDRMAGIFLREGARVTFSTPLEHDRIMAVVQGLTHFVTLSMAETMRRAGMSPAMTEEFTSPVYQIELGLVGRLLSQDPGLYADMLCMNPFVPGVLRLCNEAVQDLSSRIAEGDAEGFTRMFCRNAEDFGEYRERSLELTDSLIRAMVTR